jgi:hypothetical protein
MTKVSDPVEGSSFTSRQVRFLKIGVAIMTALLILGIMALVYGMARQASRLGTTAKPAAIAAAQSPYSRSVDLGHGEIRSVSAADGLIVLYWRGDASDTIVTFDAKDGRELGRIQVPRS